MPQGDGTAKIWRSTTQQPLVNIRHDCPLGATVDEKRPTENPPAAVQAASVVGKTPPLEGHDHVRTNGSLALPQLVANYAIFVPVPTYFGTDDRVATD